MGVERLERKDAQPFYNVIVEDGSHRSDDNSIKKNSQERYPGSFSSCLHK